MPSRSWDRRSREGSEAFEAFCTYRDAGPGRSLEMVSRTLDKSKTLLGRWSARWSWVERATAFDDHMDGIEQRARERTLERAAVDWTGRREKLREAEWEASRALWQKAAEMLSLPIVLTVEDDGKVIIKPADWSVKDIPRMAKVASELARLAAELPTRFEVIQARTTDDIDPRVAAAAIEAGLGEAGQLGIEARPIPLNDD